MSRAAKTSADLADLLDGFVRDLQASSDTAAQVRLALETIRSAVRADVACWYCAADGQSVVLPSASGRTFIPSWASLDPTDTSTRVLRPGGSAPGGAGPSPSVAMLQVSRSRAIWLIAVRHHPGPAFDTADVRRMALVRRLLQARRRHARAEAKLHEALLGLIRSLTAAINAKSPYTCGHSERVARVAVLLGRSMNLPAEEVGNLYLAGLLHDVGKIGIQSQVLQKPDALTDAEFAHVREHPVIGDAIVANVAELQQFRAGVRHHHERYDGNGYPDRLRGEEIPLVARILAVADAWDAMASARAYRAALAPEQIEATLAGGAGAQWDPVVVAHFLRCREDIRAVGAVGLGPSVVRAVETLATQAVGDPGP